MKGLHMALLVALLAFLLAVEPTGAAESCDKKAEAAAQPGAKIGLLDLDYIFKNYPRFTEKMVKLKADIQKAEEKIKKSQEEFANMTTQLQAQTFGTPEHTALEAEITATRAQMAASVETHKKAFIRREGQAYYEAYEEIRRETEDYAKAREISVVVRYYDTAAAGPGNLKAVSQHLSRQIIWRDGACDLTRAILQRLEQKSKEEPSEPAEEPPAEVPSAEDSPVKDASRPDHTVELPDNANEGTLDNVTVAVIDMGHVIKNYSHAQKMQSDLKAEVEKAEEWAKQQREELKNMIEQLKVHIVGTPQYTQLEKKIAAEHAKTTTDIKFKQREFQQRGAKMAYEVYEEIVSEVEDYAKAQGLQCVLRFNGTEVNVGAPQDVARRLREPIIWHDGACDLTQVILHRLEQKLKEKPSEPSDNANADASEAVTVAVVDVAHVFKNHSRFMEMDSDLKAEVNQAEEAVQQKREELKGMVEQLKVQIAGTPEYAQLEKKIGTENAKATSDIKFKQRDFQQRAARMSYEAYEEIVSEVEDYAKAQGLQCVLRFNSTEVNAGVPQQVAQRLSQSIVWHDAVSDVTQIILQRLEQRSKEQPSESVEEPSAEEPAAKEPPLVPPTVDRPSTGDAPRLGRCGWRFLYNPV
ncbi:MAG: OmpH family outer membrane protein [Candidatus Nealsonbacteria bacterium]|nr:OmpH family outer membrane protein [Candidatus Nealsonbacteria bacterium]